MTDTFHYSKEFVKSIEYLHRGMENWPNYQDYIEDHLGGPNSRVIKFTKYLCPEIEYHCGNLKDKKILDFGCGTGSTTVALAQNSEKVYAFDIDDESIEISKQRINEHGLNSRVQFLCSDDINTYKDSIGTFDLIVVNGVIEHIPLSRTGLRKKIMLSLFELLNKSGHIFINETPNRLWPYDFHSTQLWWLPWTKPGSEWAYNRAVKKGRYSDAPRISKGPLGLEEVGVWGVTYWEVKSYFEGQQFVCLNVLNGHNRHLHYLNRDVHYSFPGMWKRTLARTLVAFEFVMYYFAAKLFKIPITAFYPNIINLVIKRI